MKFLLVTRSVLFTPAAAAGVVRTGCAIMAQAAAILLLLMASAARPAIAQSQSQAVVVDCLPPWEANGRFLDTTLVKHPSLSLNGFDCGTNCDIGYGLKQVLEKVYGADTEQEVIRVFKNIVNKADDPFESRKIRGNTEILQARGFVALAAYVLENNDYDPTILTPALPSAAQAVASFRTALLQTSMWKMEENIDNDGLKWATPLTNAARAMDFYLALENAYKHYNSSEYSNEVSSSILSRSQKSSLMENYADLIKDMEERRIVFEFLAIRVSRYDAEPGNAPLKMQVAAGYAGLVWQVHDNSATGTSRIKTSAEERSHLISRAFYAAGKGNGTERHGYWHYQSDNGKFFWAEGPYYFHLTLSQIIPF